MIVSSSRPIAWLGVVAVLALASCGPPSQLPSGAAAVRQLGIGPAARPDRRGKVTIYDDEYGDATPQGIAAGPDGALWFTDGGNDVIGRITTAGDITMQLRPGDEVSDGITAGPDGALWFTTYSNIGRVTTDGSLTLFKDAGGSDPQGITTGPDGALWFADAGGQVGRMTTAGSVTHYTVAPGNVTLQGIVTGPDGNLWTTQQVVGGSRLSNRVIRVSPSGKFKSFKVGVGPDLICVGPDKALWFTEEGSNAIGRLTTRGAYEEFPLTDPYEQPSGIATGPDGALWFTDFSGRGGIGRMTTKGKQKYYAIPGGDDELDQIAAGPDGAMWFTSTLGPSAIGRIATK